MAEVKETKPKKAMVFIESTREDREPIWVCVNGRSYLIQRDVEVSVPAEVAEVLKLSREAKRKRYEAEAAAKAKMSAKELN